MYKTHKGYSCINSKKQVVMQEFRERQQLNNWKYGSLGKLYMLEVKKCTNPGRFACLFVKLVDWLVG